MGTMCLFDWLVVASYLLMMLLVGLYFSLKNKTGEDYMLGGRQMRPWMVGLSLFATLISAIAYLAWPGEIIKYGPMILSGLLAYPLVYYVVGWFIIPRIMKSHVNSAYELLETQLGLKVRILASILFLSLRMIWMGIVIYLSAEKVIIPVMKWPHEAAIWVSILLGMVTVIYTSLGGIRAVVVTDTIQSIILLGGVILSLIVITVKMGGASQWWPDQWNPNWVEPKFGYDPKIRVTMVGALVTWFSWYVCTAGSDQMAIQRYLSTRDIQSARRAQLISLIGDSSVACLLCVLGLAIFAYFTKYSHLIPQDWTIADHADELFPHFIVVGLPVGVTGLVISGLLAASMSSLSSGINSSCLVISEDFIARFRKKSISEYYKVKLNKIISLFIGILIIILSTTISQIKGNIFAITYKAGNLLVAPLFVPFFMALFVPFSKSTATFIGTIISVLIAVTISFWEDFTGHEGISFLWILPFSFAGGALVSVVLSLMTKSWKKKKQDNE